MFDLRQFAKDTILQMIGNESIYHIRMYALGWHMDKKVLNNDDMEEIQAAIEAYEESLLPPEVEPEDADVAEMTEEEMPAEEPEPTEE